MKRIIIALVAALAMLTSCAISNIQVFDDEISADKVIEAIEKGAFEINTQRARSYLGRTYQIPEYRLRILDGKVRARLPFFGRGSGMSAYGVEGDSSIIFDDEFVNIRVDDSKAGKGKYELSFTTTSGSGSCDVDITIWTNGSVQMTCKPYNRSVMFYSGTLRSLVTE